MIADKNLRRICNHGKFTTDFNFKDLIPVHSEILHYDNIKETYQKKSSESNRLELLSELLETLPKDQYL